MRNPPQLKLLLRLVLCLFVGFNLLIQSAFAQTFPTQIDLVVVEGEGALNSPRQRAAQDPVVRVEDENHRPVAGAAVVFTLPISGTSGDFSNGSKNLTVTTAADGLAAAHGLKTNQIPGKLQIYVTASYRGLRARALVNQVVAGTPGAHGGSSKVWIILAVVGAAAAGGVVAATHGKGNSGSTGQTPSGPTPIGITPGTGTINPPH